MREAILSWWYWLVLLFGLVVVCVMTGCGGINISTTNYYTVTGDSNRLTQTIRTDSRPDITAPTNMTATVPVSALP